MNTVLTLDGRMDLSGERPYPGMQVQVDEFDAIITDVDEEERLVFVDICDEDQDGYLHVYSY